MQVKSYKPNWSSSLTYAMRSGGSAITISYKKKYIYKVSSLHTILSKGVYGQINVNNDNDNNNSTLEELVRQLVAAHGEF